MNSAINYIEIERKTLVEVLNNLNISDYILLYSSESGDIVFNQSNTNNTIEYKMSPALNQNIETSSFFSAGLQPIIMKLTGKVVRIEFFERYIQIDSLTIQLIFDVKTPIKPSQPSAVKFFIPSALISQKLQQISKLISKNRGTSNDCVKITLSANKIVFEVTDRYFFLTTSQEFSFSVTNNQFLHLYSDTSLIVQSISSSDASILEVEYDNTNITFKCGGWTISSIPSKCQIPSNLILEQLFTGTDYVTLDLKQMVGKLNQMIQVSKTFDFKYYVKLYTKQDGKLHIKAKNSHYESNDFLPVQTDQHIEFAINAQTLKDCIQCCENSNINIYFTAKGKPIKISCVDTTIYIGTFSDIVI